MRTAKILTLAAFLIAAALGTTAFINAKHTNVPIADNKGFALIELYTSEGCSSCPPADELVAKIQKENADKPVYILAYHVDYWNRLGWKDQFSSADFSKRQNEYANYLNINSVYTPQIVVNGRTEFVGSEEGTLRNAIRTNLQKSSSAQLDLSVSATNSSHADLKYTTQGADKSTVLQVAVLQKNAQTKVLRGENGGHTLSHVQIVRELQEVSLKGNNGIANITLPHGFDTQNWEIMGFLQNTSNGAIIAASRVSFTGEAGIGAMVKSSK
ncbi:hypothetical protein JN11_03589 [Mucilaginibacter frigoritolerans]|uniref:DUF1223 domain-containing protein n=1 Tax=Mucilaginibacter frigoritolerans TaxID=652788 RepID=A0A562TU46_9SPHI|nr:DUF1223 domain-containing protein [Mucilaginibacter frigoritolerans]TWI97129.1 hypothetical protein JN11_03589 [Mucilaginibacter frigoritolerans]